MTRNVFRLKHGLLTSILILGCALQPLAQSASAPQPQQPERLRIGSEEVLLDIVVRDKRGRPVGDLKPGDIEIFEDGARQEFTSFRQVNRGAGQGAGAAKSSGVPASTTKPNATPDPLRQINLVTLVFERLNNESRVLARQAALDFLKTDLGENVFMSVYYLDQRLRLLQPFTGNRDHLQQAIESATGMASTQFADKSDALRREMETLLRTQDANNNVPAGSQSVNPGPQAAQNAVEMKFAEVIVNTLRFEDDIQRQQQGTASIHSLLALIGGQQRLTGRKTVLFFSEGLQVPPNLVEPFRAAISAANRANVSFYALDARGLVAARQNETMRDELHAAARASETQQRSRGGQAVTFEQAKIFDTAESSIRRNTQNTLGELADSTGGFLIANTNDLRKPLQRIAAELNSYYEVTYSPPAREYDGKFRRITVKTVRPDLVVQTRSGYFALPPLEGPPLMPFEMPLLAALNSKPAPRDFEYRAQALHFGANAGGVQQVLVMEVPLENMTFQTDAAAKAYRLHASLLALVRNAEGRVVERLSQDFPLTGPLDRLEALKRGNLVFSRQFRLPPGRYTLETAAQDRETKRLSARRAVLIVPPAPAGRLRLSSLTLIKRVDRVAAESADSGSPFWFKDGRIVPNLGDPIQAGPGVELPVYLVVYSASGEAAPPQLTLEFLADGQTIARAQPELPGPDEQGVIAYIAKVPADNFKPGRYQIRAVVRQGQQAAEENTFFTVGQ
jgi:VWFA-related protein